MLTIKLAQRRIMVSVPVIDGLKIEHEPGHENGRQPVIREQPSLIPCGGCGAIRRQHDRDVRLCEDSQITQTRPYVSLIATYWVVPNEW